MRWRLAFALLVPALGLGQTEPYDELESGTPRNWSASTVSLNYDVPEPVGPIELDFRIEIEPLTVTPYNAADRLRLVAASITYRDMGTIALPGELLECLPNPNPRDANLVTLYIEPTDSDTDWFDEFTSYITIPFGRPTRVALDAAGLTGYGYASVEIRITGDEIRHAQFENVAGERRTLSPVPESCPEELIRWAGE